MGGQEGVEFARIMHLHPIFTNMVGVEVLGFKVVDGFGVVG